MKSAGTANGRVAMGGAFAAADARRAVLDDEAYALFRDFIYREAGIDLGDRKQPLVQARLRSRVDAVAGGDFQRYYQLITTQAAPEERQLAIDRLTTNETHFFREPAHFRWFGAQAQKRARQAKGRKLRIWSAAASTGEEAYSIAMICSDRLGDGERFEILATDVNRRVLDGARRGVYPLEKSREIPAYYLRRYCLRGVRSMSNRFRIDPSIRQAIHFEHANLLEAGGGSPDFDFIFLRNVLIYFDRDTKRKVVANLSDHLLPEAYLITGHSESLHDLAGDLRRVQPSIYQRQ